MSLFHKEFGALAMRTIQEALEIMLKRNQAWYLKHKDPQGRIGKFFRQQLDRETTLLAQLNTLFDGYDNEKQAGLKLGAANSIGHCIARITDLLGVKGRTIDDVAMEEKLNTLLKGINDYRAKQAAAGFEQRQQEKVQPL